MTEQQITALDEAICEAIRDYDPFLTTSDAHVQMIRNEILTGRGKGRAIRYDNEGLRPFIEAANLPLDPDTDAALRQAWSQSRYKRCVAYEQIIKDDVHASGYVDLASAQTFLKVINDLGQAQNWDLSAVGEQQKVDRASDTVKQHILSFDPNHKKYPASDSNNWAGVSWLDASTLDGKSPAELNAIDDFATEYNRRRNLSVEELRELARKEVEQKTGQRTFRPGDRVDTDVQVQVDGNRNGRGYVAVDGNLASVKDRVVTSPSIDRRADSGSGQPLINKNTGVEFTRQELLVIARDQSDSARALWRQLTRINANRVNQILGQRA
jgi:hypothetical protein